MTSLTEILVPPNWNNILPILTRYFFIMVNYLKCWIVKLGNIHVGKYHEDTCESNNQATRGVPNHVPYLLYTSCDKGLLIDRWPLIWMTSSNYRQAIQFISTHAGMSIYAPIWSLSDQPFIPIWPKTYFNLDLDHTLTKFKRSPSEWDLITFTTNCGNVPS